MNYEHSFKKGLTLASLLDNTPSIPAQDLRAATLAGFPRGSCYGPRWKRLLSPFNQERAARLSRVELDITSLKQ